MITLYTWGTPNGRKISIMLEELGLDYEVKTVDIGRDEQFDPGFLAISPNNKIPAIVDHDTGQSVFESGAILVYLAEKYGKLLPEAGPERYATLQWLMFQMGGFGPMLGQAHHFMRYAPEPIAYAIERYRNEAARLYGVLDGQLARSLYVAGEAYSIADIALYPWAARHDWHGIDLADYPNVERWSRLVGERPAVRRGMTVPSA
ncbi:glutathione S-transferase family protein [Paludibacterium paludis]|uniref:Thiol:disulfide oxidoreductase n=1 Tax=Paludibacterium paludis TaxID=1225769 RepID=A0A918P4K1_9NEIS|nr:glutathione S-transferase N-terminal domain-containing protein [Paludibacterium paludis]GGY16884.1 thiol:disulfide oxidoreductase [Paludibacterium paludis]